MPGVRKVNMAECMQEADADKMFFTDWCATKISVWQESERLMHS